MKKQKYHIFRNMKLRSKLLCSYLLTCLVPLLITTTIIYHFAVKNLEEESMELAVLYSSQIVSNIDNTVAEYDRITRSVLVDNEALAQVSQIRDRSISDRINDQLQVRKFLMRIAAIKPDMDCIAFLAANDSFYEYGKNGANGNINIERLKEEEWFQEMLRSRKVLTVSTAHFKTYYESGQDGIVVTIGRTLYDNSGRKMGTLLIDLNPFLLVEMNDNFKLTRNHYNIQIQVTSLESGGLLYDSDVVSGKNTWQELLSQEVGEEAKEAEAQNVGGESGQDGQKEGESAKRVWQKAEVRSAQEQPLGQSELLNGSNAQDNRTAWKEGASLTGLGIAEELIPVGETAVRIETKEQIIIRDSAHDGELLVEAVIPRDQLMNKASKITAISAIVIGISVCTIIGLSILLSRTITHPLTALQEKMGGIGEGKYHKIEDYQSQDEVGNLIQHYNMMVEQIQKLINDVYLAQIKQKDAKLTALRTQINPHMLYNTLESIRMKALVKGDAEVAEMIKILSKMFRASLGKDDDQNTIRNELEYVENYIKLQNVRFQGRFHFTYEVPGELLDMPIVPLVFQPIVENCVEHGNRNKGQELSVRLTIEELDLQRIRVVFMDDGAGMTEEKMAQLNEMFAHMGQDNMTAKDEIALGKSIGLRNIAERIYLRYGREYGIHILESSEKGTVITLLIPKVEGKDIGER